MSSSAGVVSSRTPAIRWTLPLTTAQVLHVIRAEPDVQKALSLFESAAGDHSSGYRHDHSTFSLISARLAAAGLPRSAETLLNRAHSELGDPPAEPSFLPVIRAYSRARRPSDALRLFRRLTSDFHLRPSHRSYNAALSALVANSRLSLAKTLFNEMNAGGVLFTAATFNILIKALCSSPSSAMATALGIFRRMPDQGCRPDACTYNTLIDGLCRHGRPHDARKLFDEMPQPTVITFTSLMDGLCRAGLLEDALQLFADMRGRGIKPNVVTYTSLIDGLCKGGRCSEATGLLESMGREGCSPTVITYTALVDGLCGQRRLPEALEVFDKMRLQGRKPDAGLYGKIIKILCESKRYQEAANYLDEMALCGVVPNRLTWGLHVRSHNAVIRGLCGARAAVRAFQVYRSTRSRGITVEPETYGILVDVCCREGDVDKAMRIVEGMMADGCFPDRNAWFSILGILWAGRKVREAAELIWDELLCGGFRV